MNMKKTVVLVVLSVYYLAVYAQKKSVEPVQEKNHNMGLEVAAGYSMALGTYASSDRQNKKSGYATGGWHLQLTFDWMGKKDFGLALSYAYQYNPFGNASNVVYPFSGQSTDSLVSGSWSNHYLLIGPVFMKTIGKLHLDARILGGVVVSSSANFDTPDPTDTTGSKSNKNIATGFAYQVSAGVGYAVSKHLVFKVNLGLLGGWPAVDRKYGSQFIGYVTYKDPITGISYTKSVYSAPVEYDIKKVLVTFNPSVGLIYKF